MDFDDPNIKPQDCVVAGHIIPMIKRISYKHENEFRGFITPQLHKMELDGFTPEAINIPVDLAILIDKIYISPMANEPFISSVKAICEKYDILKKQIVKSKLLDKPDYLDDIFNNNEKFPEIQ